MSMHLALASIIAGFACLALALLRRWRRTPYVRTFSVLSRGEAAFLPALRLACAGRWEIHAQVRLGAVVSVRQGLNVKKAWAARSRVDRKSVDFVLAEPQTHRTAAVIELNDSTHLLGERQIRDAFVSEVLRAAGIPLIAVRAASRYDPAVLRRRIEAAVLAGG